jgi:hypothetical protein
MCLFTFNIDLTPWIENLFGRSSLSADKEIPQVYKSLCFSAAITAAHRLALV